LVSRKTDAIALSISIQEKKRELCAPNELVEFAFALGAK
jgi:hypothetical protein